MQTVIRLKRSLEDTPSDALILNCSKKQKVEDTLNTTGSLSTVLKFSGTQSSQNDDLSEHVKSIKDSLKAKVLQKFKHDVDVKQKLRLEAQERSKSDRYKIVNFLRSNISTEESVTVLDIEPEGEDKSETDRKYVYDIYYTDAKFWEEIGDYDINIYPTTETFLSDDVYIDESDEDSEDSNAENYFTNDYPDESEVDSVNGNDIVESMNNMGLDDLSSSDDEYVHYNDTKDDFCEDLQDYSDEESYKSAYKRFKEKYGGDEELSDELDAESDDSAKYEDSYN